jgi:YD repeat-containing protein
MGYGFQRQGQALVDAGSSVVLLRDDGQRLFFTKQGTSSSYVAVGGHGFALSRSGTGFTLKTPDNALETYSSAGRLSAIRGADGRVVTIASDSAGRVTTVTDDTGRALTFQYRTSTEYNDTIGALVAVVLPDGRKLSYEVEAPHGWLMSVTFPDGSSRRYGYTPMPVHNSFGDNLLTSVTDESSRTSSFEYDSSGVASSTSLAGGVGRWERVDRRTNGVGDVQLTSPLGSSYSVRFENVNGAQRIVSRSQPAGSGCAAASRSMQYDSAGRLVRTTDFNNVATTREHDVARNLEVKRIEAVQTAAARTISTEWHPDWELRSREATPQRITTWVYNGRPDPTAGGVLASCAPSTARVLDKPIAVLCKRIEQATTDTSGAAGFAATPTGPARVQAYTYDATGRVLSVNGPRAVEPGVVDDRTVYEY